MSNPIADPGHGSSPAAWTAVTIMLIAVATAVLAFCLDMPWLMYASTALLVVGWIIGGVMAKLGYGVKGPKWQPKAH